MKTLFRNIKFLFLTATLGVLSGCESSGDGTQVDAPNIDIVCSTSKCTSGLPSKDAYVVLSLSGCAPDQIGFDTIASGTTQLLCTGGSCRGTVTNVTPDTISARSYYVCGWVDVNDDSLQNSADAFAEDNTYISGSPLSLTSWSVTYSFSRQRHPQR